MNYLRDLNTLFDVLNQASVEFVKTLAEHYQRRLQKVNDLRRPTGGGLQEIKERHFD